MNNRVFPDALSRIGLSTLADSLVMEVMGHIGTLHTSLCKKRESVATINYIDYIAGRRRLFRCGTLILIGGTRQRVHAT